MKPRELAVLLNVSQVQILRHVQNKTTPTLYELESWRREMRLAEMHLRNITPLSSN